MTKQVAMILAAALAACFLGVGVAQAAYAPAASVPLAALAAPAVPQTAPARTQMTPEELSALKAALDSSKDLTRHVNVSAGVRTLTYTYTSGSALVLEERVGPDLGASLNSASVGAGRCGFGFCIRLNRTDQAALKAGGVGVLGVALCAIPGVGQVACAGIGVALAVGMVYLGDNPFCAKELAIRVLPPPLAFPRCT
jgi:hypothetical protein